VLPWPCKLVCCDDDIITVGLCALGVCSKACFGMEEFETARDTLTEAAARFGTEPRSKTAKLWLRRCQAELDAEDLASSSASGAGADAAAAPSAVESAEPAAAPVPAFAPQGFIRKRFDWFQTMTEVSITLFAKGARSPLPEGAVRIAAPESASASGAGPADNDAGSESQMLVVSIPHTPPQATEEQVYTLEMHLGGKVTGQPAIRAGKVNVEVVLTKADAVQWPDLQRMDGPREPMAVSGTAVGTGLRGSASVSAVVDTKLGGAAASSASASSAAGGAAAAAAAGAEAARRVVPRGPQEWAAMAKDLEEAAKDEVQPEGDEALQALFKQIYAKGSAETRRAMNKSFSESNGKTLSTNWSEVAQAEYDRDHAD
jgi:suppressor of G2 allele of SKP1